MVKSIHGKLQLKPGLFKNLQLGQCSFGKGVFAAEDIRSGEKIMEFGGSIISSAELPYPYEAEKDYFLQVGQDLYLGPSGTLDDYVNHSCNPNSAIRINKNTVELIAISFIRFGDQITFNYATTMNSNWGEFECACGSNECLGMVKKFVDLPEPIQKKYIELKVVPNYILAKIKNI